MASKSPGRGWRLKVECIELLNVSATAFDRTYIVMCDDESLKRDGNRTWIHFPTLIRKIREKDKETSRRESMATSGPADGSAEAKRIVETKLKEIELRRKLRELIPVEEVGPALAKFASRLAAYGDAIGRKETTSGADVQRTLNEIVEEGMESFRALTETGFEE